MFRHLGFAGLLLMSLQASAEGWTLRFQEGDRWVTERIVRARDGWPEVKSQKFSLSIPADQKMTLERTGRELRGTSDEVLWTATEKWSLEWEDKWAHWIASEVDIDFFTKYKLATDCADVEYALRWIFARNNGLEMAARLKGSGDFFTHRSVRDAWKALPTAEKWYEDRRFMAALNYLLPMTFTHTLMQDSYPVLINRDALKPGAFHLEIHGTSGHTQVIYRTQSEDPFLMLPFLIFQSTTPRAIRQMMSDGFWQMMPAIPDNRGLRRMRWPDFSKGEPNLIPAEAMPFYSNEQFDPSFFRLGVTSFYEEVYLRLKPDLKMNQVAIEGLKSLQQALKERRQVVVDGFQFCKSNPCPKGSGGYDSWSTPSRDHRVTELILQIDAILYRFGETQTVSELLGVPFLEIEGITYKLREIMAAWRAGTFSSDPNESVARRWGLSGEGVAEWLQARWDELSAIRGQFLSSGRDPLETDRKFSHLYEIVQSYCTLSDPSNCQSFNSFLDKGSSTLDGVQRTYREWIQRIPWFVSDFKSKERWWGAHADRFQFINLSSKEALFLKSGYQLTREASGWAVAKSEAGGEKIIRAGFASEIAALLQEGPVLVGVQGGEVKFDNLVTAQIQTLSLNFKPTRLVGYRNTFVAADEATGNFAIGEIANGKPQWIHQDTALWFSREFTTDAPGFDRNQAFMYGTGQAVKIWDFSESLPRVYSVEGVNSRHLFANNPHWIGLHEGGILLKDSGEFLPRLEAKRALQCHASGSNCVLVRPAFGSAYEFAKILPKGEFAPELTLGKMSLQIETQYLVDWFGLNQGKAYRWNELGLQEVPPLPDEELVVGVFGEIVFATLKSTGVRVRKGAQELFQGVGYFVNFNISPDNEAYFEIFDPATARISLRSVREPQKLISNSGIVRRPQYFTRAMPGLQTSAGFWIR